RGAWNINQPPLKPAPHFPAPFNKWRTPIWLQTCNTGRKTCNTGRNGTFVARSDEYAYGARMRTGPSPALPLRGWGHPWLIRGIPGKPDLAHIRFRSWHVDCEKPQKAVIGEYICADCGSGFCRVLGCWGRFPCKIEMGDSRESKALIPCS